MQVHVRTACLIVLLLVMAGIAQETKNGSMPSIRVDVDLVLLHAAVTDSQNRSIKGLKHADFRVWEDKIEQQIDYFSTENVPVTVGIIFDSSGSMADKLTPAQVAADAFLDMSDRDDEFFLMEFNNSPSLVRDFTTDTTRIQSALLFTQAKGSTSLYDALYLGMDKVRRGRNARKALLLITDGQDNHSRYSLSDVREFAREHDVTIYSIGILPPVAVSLPEFNGRQALRSLGELTGGAAFFPQSIDALPAICAQIGLDLKNQYLLGYRPLNASNDGKWRKIRVGVKSQAGRSLHVRAKSGYYASTMPKNAK
jgi:Ca-activated chloride channel family protein